MGVQLNSKINLIYFEWCEDINPMIDFGEMERELGPNRIPRMMGRKREKA